MLTPKSAIAVLTWDHRDPAEFRAAARKDLLDRYSTTTAFEDVSISSLKKMEREDGTSLFKAVDEKEKEWWGRKVVLATGITDLMPDIPGYEDCWVKSMYVSSPHSLEYHASETLTDRLKLPLLVLSRF